MIFCDFGQSKSGADKIIQYALTADCLLCRLFMQPVTPSARPQLQKSACTRCMSGSDEKVAVQGTNCRSYYNNGVESTCPPRTSFNRFRCGCILDVLNGQCDC